MKAFTSLLSLDRCPREMGSLSCKLQRDTTAPGNHEMHQRHTPSGLIIKGQHVVESVITASLSSQPVVESSLWVVVKEICIPPLPPYSRDDEADLSDGSSSAVALLKL